MEIDQQYELRLTQPQRLRILISPFYKVVLQVLLMLTTLSVDSRLALLPDP